MSGDSEPPTSNVEPEDYCRQVETYLCRKNDGHLIRVVGPSFDLVSRWAADGVPLKIVFRGIDRCFERYYRKGPRRRPVRIDYCEADVLDVFDEWRRAVGVGRAGAGRGPDARGDHEADGGGQRPSLPAHIERALIRLTDARTSGAAGPDVDPLLDRLSQELDAARSSGGVRGHRREALLERLQALDAELMSLAIAGLPEATRRGLEQSADEDLAAFRRSMAPEAYARARAAAIDNLARERLALPVLSYR